MKDVIEWLLSRNQPSLCHQTPIQEPIKDPSNNMSSPRNTLYGLQLLKPIEESPTMDTKQDPSCSYVVDHLEHIKPPQEPSISIQTSQELCQGNNPKHVEH